MPCHFCLDTKNLVTVCLTCRTRLETLEREVVRLRQDLALRERQVWAFVKERDARRDKGETDEARL